MVAHASPSTASARTMSRSGMLTRCENQEARTASEPTTILAEWNRRSSIVTWVPAPASASMIAGATSPPFAAAIVPRTEATRIAPPIQVPRTRLFKLSTESAPRGSSLAR